MRGVNLPNGFDPAEHKRRARKFANALPTRDNCDLDDPLEMFLWMLVAPPGVNGGAQAMPSSYNMLVSQHLYECGAMLRCPACGYSRDPEKTYVPPSADDPHWLTSPGRWSAPQDVPIRGDDPIDKALQEMHPQMKAGLLQRLLKMREEGS